MLRLSDGMGCDTRGKARCDVAASMPKNEIASTILDAEDQLCENIRELLKTYRWTQAELAERLGRTQPWVSKRMTRNPDAANKWKVEDLDGLVRVFQLAPWELLRPGHGRLDRRSPYARRVTDDRRTSHQSGGALVTSSRLTDVESTDRVIEAANALYELGQQLLGASRTILGRHAAALSNSPSDGSEDD
ncbi:MAG TPA: helix-turn-helix transcriptional regulator, partial [Vicinamibacterales bacterium]|nr:helix-turn-helix transcriptional regulator [Vicinamibacterales bacterium]